MSLDSFLSSSPYFEMGVLVITVSAVTSWLAIISTRAKRRAAELNAAKRVLLAHYEATNMVLGDPALPDAAREALAYLVEFVADREKSVRFVREFMDMNVRSSSRSKDLDLAMNKLWSTRPDLVENYHKAMRSGLVAMLLRWPQNSSQFYRFAAEIESTSVRDGQIAERISLLKKSVLGERQNGTNAVAAAAC